MAYAKRGNKLMKIADDDIQKYLENGFDIVDEIGTVVEMTVPKDVESLRARVASMQQTIDAQKCLIESLQNEIASMKSAKTEKSDAPQEKAKTKAKTKAPEQDAE